MTKNDAIWNALGNRLIGKANDTVYEITFIKDGKVIFFTCSDDIEESLMKFSDECNYLKEMDCFKFSISNDVAEVYDDNNNVMLTMRRF